MMTTPGASRGITEAEVHHAMALLPDGCFLKAYVKYGESQVGSNIAYHIGTGLAMLSAVAPLNLTLTGGKATTFQNVYVLLVGSSGDAEKTTGMNVGRTLLAEVDQEILSSDPTAEETLLKMLAKRPNRLFFYPDYATFLSKTAGKDQRGEGLRSGFMSLFDGLYYSREYANGKKFEVATPRPSILAACTPQHLESYTSSIDWEGGFMSRHLILWGERERTREWPDQNPYTRELKHFLLEWLKWSVKQPVAEECSQITPEAMRHMDEWKGEIRRRYETQHADEMTKGIISRSKLMLSKVCLLLSWSRGACVAPWALDVPAVLAGIAITDMYLKSMLELTKNIAQTPAMMEQKRILNAVREQWTPLGEITDRAKITKKRALEYIETLVEENKILPVEQGGSKFYRRTPAGTTPIPFDEEAERKKQEDMAAAERAAQAFAEAQQQQGYAQ